MEPDSSHRTAVLVAGGPEILDENILLTDGYRHILRGKIAAGRQSLLHGAVTDGDAFMDRLDAELAALDRQRLR